MQSNRLIQRYWVLRRPFQAGTAAIYAREAGMPDAPLKRVALPMPVRPLIPRALMALPVRRFLSIGEAAEYVGVSVATFREEVADGRWPQPVRRGRTGRAVTWDVRALDLAADLAAGISAVGPAIIAPSEVDKKKVAEAAAMARFK